MRTKKTALYTHYAWRAEPLVFIAFTLLSILNQKTTIFYIIYLFWWTELLHLLIGRFFLRKQWRAASGPKTQQPSMFNHLFLMGIYWVFIIVFFGLMANWRNEDIMMVNFEVLLFRNLFFNLNLAYIIMVRIGYCKTLTDLPPTPSLFTTGMIILHISVIVGGILMFFVVKKFPEIFTPENLWGSAIIIAPFLALRLLIGRRLTEK
ncbi:hypothetical protein ABDK00_013585 [Niabella insulamsoli]|uniref:hypothetical protein n=1 Tax=Niabella insulamsoli TaxID=3144874 RepID=UPI0031FC13B6